MPTLALHPGNPVEDLQVRLKLAGFYDGSVDGRMSAHTSRSLRAFQQAHGLSATGRLDARTIAAVGMISGPIPAGGTMPVGGTMSQAGGSVGNMR
jgi:peptidoglycan hydrolase-like protein with peptidoglycan-binding domain